MERLRNKSKKKSRLAVWLLLGALLLAHAACRKKGTALLEQGQAAWDNNDYKGAVAGYEKFLKENPGSSQIDITRFKLANIYLYNLKNYDLATQHYIHIIEDFPKFADIALVRQRLAESYTGAKDYRAAIQEYENLLLAFPDFPDKRRIRLLVADRYFDLNELGQALAEYDKVLAENVFDDLSQRAYLRKAGIHVIRDEFEAALQAYQRVAESTGDATVRRTARYGMADCYERTFKFDEAVKVLENTEPDAKTPDYSVKRIAAIREQQRQRQIVVPNGTMSLRH